MRGGSVRNFDAWQQSVTRRVYLGIDVSKARIDVYIHRLGRTFAVSNDADGLKRLKKAVAGCDVTLVVMEATGKFHRLAHRFLRDRGFKIAVNPARARKFAAALGALAKTDPLDARFWRSSVKAFGPSPLRRSRLCLSDYQQETCVPTRAYEGRLSLTQRSSNQSARQLAAPASDRCRMPIWSLSSPHGIGIGRSAREIAARDREASRRDESDH